MSFILEENPKKNYFHVFESKCFILNNKDNLRKFAVKFNEDIFLGYSSTRKAYKAYRVYNHRTLIYVESIHVVLISLPHLIFKKQKRLV
jgi:hypothetical protein